MLQMKEMLFDVLGYSLKQALEPQLTVMDKISLEQKLWQEVEEELLYSLEFTLKDDLSGKQNAKKKTH